MSKRFLPTAIALSLAAVAHAAVETAAVTPLTMSPGRIAASSAGIVAILAAILGKRAHARSDSRGAIVALVLGAIAILVGGLVVVTADGGIGTGNGLGGGIVAMTIGLIGMTFGGLARSRSRRAE